MKRWRKLITHRWRAKLASLLLAVVVWFLIRRAVPEAAPAPPPPPAPAAPAHG